MSSSTTVRKNPWSALRRRLRRSGAEFDPYDPALVVVASVVDEAESCTAVLARAAESAPPWDASAQALSRYHLRVPAHAIAEVEAIAAQSGYEVAGSPEPGDSAERPVVLQRVERIDVLHLAQERARMAGLAQRNDGTVCGWEALQPGPALQPG